MPDHLTPAQRSWNMSRIRSTDTGPEIAIRRRAHARGLRYRIHVYRLPGRPDMVFTSARLVVFIDGDFWHGWRFPVWAHRLRPFWREKIERNRRRDAKNYRKLRRSGWSVMRIWEHEVKASPDRCVNRIVARLQLLKADSIRAPLPPARLLSPSRRPKAPLKNARDVLPRPSTT